MLKSLSNTQKGILAAFAGFTGFAFADACSKWLGAHYESINIIFWVYYLAMFFGLALSPFLGGFKQTLKTTKLHLHILRGACAMAVGILIVTALSQGMQLATTTGPCIYRVLRPARAPFRKRDDYLTLPIPKHYHCRSYVCYVLGRY